MKKLLTLALLFCTTLLSAQTQSITEWQEIDTLLAQGHYTSAYEQSEALLRRAKRKGDSHAMLKAVYKASRTSGQMSFEERMGCGFGACMGCSCKTLTGYKRICKDGPVMMKEEIKWES